MFEIGMQINPIARRISPDHNRQHLIQFIPLGSEWGDFDVQTVKQIGEVLHAIASQSVVL